MSELKNKYDFLVLFDVEHGNPNGDPDDDGRPRTDFETGVGIITDGCTKSKLRNYVDIVHSGKPGYNLFIKTDKSLNAKTNEALVDLNIDKDEIKRLKKEDPDFLDNSARDWMCKNYFDVRAFGAVLTGFTKLGLNCGQVKGPIQIGFASSFDPISIQDVTISRQAVATDKEFEDHHTTLGNKFITPYGLYGLKGHISPALANKNFFTEEDLAVFWDALVNMFEFDRSSMRGEMAVRKVVIFKHDSMWGNAPSYQLMSRINVEKNTELPRSYKDYTVTIDTQDMPEGVTLTELV